MQMLLCCSRGFPYFSFFFVLSLFASLPPAVVPAFPSFPFLPPHVAAYPWNLVPQTTHKLTWHTTGPKQDKHVYKFLPKLNREGRTHASIMKNVWKALPVGFPLQPLFFSAPPFFSWCVNLIDWHHLSVRTTKNMYICTYVSGYRHIAGHGRKNKRGGACKQMICELPAKQKW